MGGAAVAGEVDQVRCYFCQSLFDTSSAVFCNCITKEQSLCCPSCLECSCRAPRAYRHRLWQDAPVELLARRRANRDEAFAAEELSPDPRAVPRPLVLVAEVVPHSRLRAVSAIRTLGYGVVWAHSGSVALTLVRSASPDLVLTRALLPKVDGREVCRLLKADQATSRIPVVVMTSVFTEPRYRYEAFRDFGVDEYLCLPIPLRTLRGVLQKYLG